MVYAKFIEKDKNIIFHIGNNSLNFKRAKDKRWYDNGYRCVYCKMQ